LKSAMNAEQVGSLLRPQALLEAREAHMEGRLPLSELRAREDAAIRDAVQKQRDIGIDWLSDGEMRRQSCLTDMADAVDGFVKQKVMLGWKGPGGGSEASSANAVGAKLRKARKLTGHEVPLMNSLAAGRYKVTLPAPSNFMVSSYKPGLT